MSSTSFLLSQGGVGDDDDNGDGDGDCDEYPCSFPHVGHDDDDHNHVNTDHDDHDHDDHYHDHDYDDHDKNAHHVILPGQLGGDWLVPEFLFFSKDVFRNMMQKYEHICRRW